MTDQTAANAVGTPHRHDPGILDRIIGYFRGGHVIGRAIILAALTFILVIPLNLIGGVINERQRFQKDAEASVTRAWSGPQTFAGPLLVVPYKRIDNTNQSRYTLLPEKLSIQSRIEPQQRKRGLFAVTVYNVVLDVEAEFQPRDIRALVNEFQIVDWNGARLEMGVTDSRSIDLSVSEVDGEKLTWTVGDGGPLSSHRALLPGRAGERDNFTVKLRVTLAGSTSLGFVPLGGRTDIAVESPWPSPSFAGNRLPHTQRVDDSGFTATWSKSALGRRYSQLWDSNGSGNSDPTPATVLQSGFGVTLLSPVDAYRETDRTIKYAIMFIGLTFAACMLFEMATGTQPHVAQYGLIGLSLCVFYLLLLSLAEQIGFLPAYLVSAAAIVLQATFYVWKLQGSRLLGLALRRDPRRPLRRAVRAAAARGSVAARRAR